MEDQLINHFSHDHPLTTLFADHKDLEDAGEDPKPYFCSICGLPILSSPSYACSVDSCNFFLHKACAQLQSIWKHPRYHTVAAWRKSHALRLRLEPSRASSIYECEDCGYKLHPLVAGAVEIKTRHKSHQAHLLVANCRETLSLCDACGEEHRGFFFTCHDYWIHPDCTLLPSYLKLASHPHPLCLIYTPSQLREEAVECFVCERETVMHFGVYYCGECIGVFSHINCAVSNRDDRLKTETGVKLIQLPPDEDDGDAYPNSVMARHVQRLTKFNENHQDDSKIMMFDGKYHELHLIRDASRELTCSSAGSSSSSKLVCDICVRSIDVSSPFHACQHQHCRFVAHNICAAFVSNPEVQDGLFLYRGRPCPDPSKFLFHSVFWCYFCRRPCSGLCILLEDIDAVLGMEDKPMGCLECSAQPGIITHASHKNHLLVRTNRLVSITIPLACCSMESHVLDVYRCVQCPDFHIHVGCALLPKRTRHKFDEHPLELITHRRRQCCFCEFCEGDIEQQYWYYGCDKCEQYFHINCIPSVGYFSRINFDKTHVDHQIHGHPLTLTHMLTIGRNERCGYCQKIIPGFVQEMAFRCFQCDFWIHFQCARDSSCHPKLSVYWELARKFERLWITF